MADPSTEYAKNMTKNSSTFDPDMKTMEQKKRSKKARSKVISSTSRSLRIKEPSTDPISARQVNLVGLTLKALMKQERSKFINT